MGLCKPAHYSSQRKIRKAEGTTLAVIWSSENVSRKARGKKKKKGSFPDVWKGFSGWQGNMSQPLLPLKWQSCANALREKGAPVLALYILKYNITKLPADQWLSGISDHALIVANSDKSTTSCTTDVKALWKPETPSNDYELLVTIVLCSGWNLKAWIKSKKKKKKVNKLTK